MGQAIRGAEQLLMNPRCLPSRFSIEDDRTAMAVTQGPRTGPPLRPATMIRVLRRHFAARAESSRNLSAATW